MNRAEVQLPAASMLPASSLALVIGDLDGPHLADRCRDGHRSVGEHVGGPVGRNDLHHGGCRARRGRGSGTRGVVSGCVGGLLRARGGLPQGGRREAAAAAKWRREGGREGPGHRVSRPNDCWLPVRPQVATEPHFSRVDRPRPKASAPTTTVAGPRCSVRGTRAGPIRGGVHPSSTRRSSRSEPGRRRRRRSQRPTSRPRGRGSRSRPRVRATAATSCRG